MPLTAKGEEILAAMEKEYGGDKGKQVFYASKNAGKISGVDRADAGRPREAIQQELAEAKKLLAGGRFNTINIPSKEKLEQNVRDLTKELEGANRADSRIEQNVPETFFVVKDGRKISGQIDSFKEAVAKAKQTKGAYVENDEGALEWEPRSDSAVDRADAGDKTILSIKSVERNGRTYHQVAFNGRVPGDSKAHETRDGASNEARSIAAKHPENWGLSLDRSDSAVSPASSMLDAICAKMDACLMDEAMVKIDSIAASYREPNQGTKADAAEREWHVQVFKTPQSSKHVADLDIKAATKDEAAKIAHRKHPDCTGIYVSEIKADSTAGELVRLRALRTELQSQLDRLIKSEGNPAKAGELAAKIDDIDRDIAKMMEGPDKKKAVRGDASSYWEVKVYWKTGDFDTYVYTHESEARHMEKEMKAQSNVKSVTVVPPRSKTRTDADKHPMIGKQVKINAPGIRGHGETGRVLSARDGHLQIQSAPSENTNYMIPEGKVKVVS